MRHSEILRIRYDDISFNERQVFVSKAKAGQREQPIRTSLASALWRQREMEDDKDGWVFGHSAAGEGWCGFADDPEDQRE